MLRRIVNSQWFALADMILVMLIGAIWMTRPEAGLWIVLIAMLPWLLRLLAGRFPFRRTPFDWLIAIFLVTAWVGYWAAYDKTTAWYKVWLIVLAVLLYYALSAQPKQNLVWLSILLFCTGIGVAIYFFLTHDFTGNSGGIALWWMDARPRFEWTAVHHGYISGILVITTMFALYGIREAGKTPSRRLWIFSSLLILPGLGIMIGAFIITLSRGIWLAIAGAVGMWIIWRILSLGNFASSSNKLKPLFPVFVLVCLSAIVLLIYIGPGGPNYNPASGDFGGNTRSELFLRSVYFLEDFPIIGGGLNSFPGLYSQYVLVIPFYYFVNSYNVFLDVAIEQGLIGGLAFLIMYIGSVWLVSRAVVKAQSPEMRLFGWLSLFALTVAIVHGMLYDYLYNGMGTLLLFLPVGASMNASLNSFDGVTTPGAGPRPTWKRDDLRVMLIVLVFGGVLIATLVSNADRIRSIWFANLGAVRMAQAELAGFPKGEWTDPESAPDMKSAEESLRASIQLDPANRTANHRLGLISMLRADFKPAVDSLESALLLAPGHRGITKSLGYCHVWMGDFGRAQSLLSEIPEAKYELGVYIWWWGVQGRSDLSEKASLMISRLESADIQP